MSAYSDILDTDTGGVLTLDQSGQRGQFVLIATNHGEPVKVLVSDLAEFVYRADQFSLASR